MCSPSTFPLDETHLPKRTVFRSVLLAPRTPIPLRSASAFQPILHKRRHLRMQPAQRGSPLLLGCCCAGPADDASLRRGRKTTIGSDCPTKRDDRAARKLLNQPLDFLEERRENPQLSASVLQL